MPTPEELAYDAAAFRAYTRAMLEGMGWLGKGGSKLEHGRRRRHAGAHDASPAG